MSFYSLYAYKVSFVPARDEPPARPAAFVLVVLETIVPGATDMRCKANAVAIPVPMTER
jgi:hypothetical protein